MAYQVFCELSLLVLVQAYSTCSGGIGLSLGQPEDTIWGSVSLSDASAELWSVLNLQTARLLACTRF